MIEQTLCAVIWDMDGVIADTGDFHFRSWQFAFNKRNKIFTEKDFQHIFGQRNDTIVRGVMGMEVLQSEVDNVANDKEKYFRGLVKSNIQAFPGVITLLKTLKANDIAVAVASSAPMENIKLVLEEIGIMDYFQAIVFGREVAEGKPSPQVFLKAAQKLSVKPEGCVVIEDSVAGVEGAKRAGMHCIAVTNTHEAAGLTRADLVVDSLEKVTILDLDNLFKA